MSESTESSYSGYSPKYKPTQQYSGESPTSSPTPRPTPGPAHTGVSARGPSPVASSENKYKNPQVFVPRTAQEEAQNTQEKMKNIQNIINSISRSPKKP